MSHFSFAWIKAGSNRLFASWGRRRVAQIGGSGLLLALAAPPWLSQGTRSAEAEDRLEWGVDARCMEVEGFALPQQSRSVASLSSPERTIEELQRALDSAFNDESDDAPLLVNISSRRGGREVCGAIAGANVLVYGGWWLLPEAFMYSWFSSSAVEAYVRPWKGLVTALTSSFSHRELWHLGFNMIALMSFGPALVDGPRYRDAVSRSRSKLRNSRSVGYARGVAVSTLHIFCI